jgi:prepilin-type N-terminal cleavage/methylation domain-containing protein
MMRRSKVSGFTLVELLVVIAIIGILASIALPAIYSARQAALLAQCGANLRHIGLAINSYEATNRRYPPAYAQLPQRHNVIAYILPQLGQQPIADAYRYDVHWSHASNRTAARADIPQLHCPSTLRSGNMAGNSDYAVCTMMRKSVHDRLVSAGAISPRKNLTGFLQAGFVTRAHVTDGASSTFLFFEDCGRPNRYLHGGLLQPGTTTGARWADEESYFHVHDTCGTSMINCSNANEIFSFHRGGCQFLFGDASVRFLRENIDPEVFVSHLTRAAGDIISAP